MQIWDDLTEEQKKVLYTSIANRSLENEIFLGLLSDCSVVLCMYVQHNTLTSIDLQS